MQLMRESKYVISPDLFRQISSRTNHNPQSEEVDMIRLTR